MKILHLLETQPISLFPSTGGELSPETKRALLSECSEYLSNPVPLFRGTREQAHWLSKSPIRTNRRSLSEMDAQATLFDEMFREKHNISNIRKSCHFASTTVNGTSEFGIAYALIPINGSIIASQSGRSDSLEILERMWSRLLRDLNPLNTTPEETETLEYVYQSLSEHPSSIAVYREGISQLSQPVQDAINANWAEYREVAVGKYNIDTPGNITRYDHHGAGNEAMITNATHSYLAHWGTLCDRAGSITPDTVLKSFVQYLHS